MTDRILGGSEFRAVWVFHGQMSPEERTALLKEYRPDPDGPLFWPLAQAVGVDSLDHDFVDFIEDDELNGYPLSKFLVDGHGMDPASVAPDAEKLDALRGQVVLVHSSALGGTEPSQAEGPLTFVGRYSEALKNDATAMPHVQSAIEAAANTSPEPVPAKKKPSDAAMSGRVATIALLVMAFLVWLMIKIAG